MLGFKRSFIHTGLQPGVRPEALKETVSTVFPAFSMETVKTVS
jgi:hypothetical protein